MTKIYVVDVHEVKLKEYDVAKFCKLWNKGDIVAYHRSHHQYKIYSDIKKAQSLFNLFNQGDDNG